MTALVCTEFTLAGDIIASRFLPMLPRAHDYVRLDAGGALYQVSSVEWLIDSDDPRQAPMAEVRLNRVVVIDNTQREAVAKVGEREGA